MGIPYWQKFETPVIVSQIGWDPAGGNAVLTVLPAGHTPGMYEVSLVLVVRTAFGGQPTATLSGWTAPTFGADSEAMSSSIAAAGVTGTILGNGNTSTASHRMVPLMSTGATALTLTMSGGTSGLADIYVCARLIAPS